MAPEISRITDRDYYSGSQQYSVEQLLLGGMRKSAWEQSLYNRGIDMSSAMYYKYPLELGMEMDQLGCMVFEIYDTGSEKLSTRREILKLINTQEGSDAANIEAAQKRAEEGTTLGAIESGITKVADVVGLKVAPVTNVVKSGGALIQGAVNQAWILWKAQAAVGDFVPRTEEQRLLLDSVSNEETGYMGGTTKVLRRIYLYIPNNVQSDYGFQYEDSSFAGNDVFKLFSTLMAGSVEAAAGLGKKWMMNNVKLLEKIPGFGIGGNMENSMQALSREIVNPMNLHLFKDVKRRTFTFSYTFLPKNRQEMMNCHQIINTLKYYAHPKLAFKGRMLDYPAEFHIKFKYPGAVGGGKAAIEDINAYLPYIFKCALTDIKVTYGEDSVMSTFVADKHGAPPTKIKMDLSFTELEILTRDRFSLDPGAINP